MDTTLTTLIDLFAATKQTEGQSSATIEWYRGKLAAFAEFLGNGHVATIRDITLSSARAFVASLQEKDILYEDHPYRQPQEGGLSTQTVHGYVRTLKAFSAWLYEEDFTNGDVLARLKRPKTDTPIIEILSDGELDQILAIINPRTIVGSRQQLIFLLLLDTGMRAGELCSLKVEDVHLDQDFLKIKGKGNKERFVPICGNTKKAILHYLNTWRPEPATQQVNQLVLSEDGLPLTTGALLQIIKRLGKKAGVPRLHPHLFRHTFAVKYLMNGGDVMTPYDAGRHPDVYAPGGRARADPAREVLTG